MRLPSRIPAFLVALAGLAQSQVALAQTEAQARLQPCLTEEEVSALAVYAAPSIIQGLSMRCSSTLSSNGFLATEGAALADRFAQRQQEAWPTARSAALKLLDKPEQAQLVRQLPEEAVRPLMGAVVGQMAMKHLKTADCATAERGLEILSPLPVESVGGMLGVVLALAPMPGGPRICPLDGASAPRKFRG